jgi:peptidoglycan/xylan/chitin deacetylase (PgdA/CDA1 family)
VLNIYRTPFFLPWLYPSLLWRVPTKEKIIYLTFDDGPVPGPTEFVVENLKRHNAKATFFCIGDNVKKHPEIIKKVMDDGHTIGNHTFNHLKGWSTSTDKYLENVKQCDDQFVTANSPVPILFRPPYGRITKNQIRGLGQYKIVMWDVLSHDYRQSGSNENCLLGTIRSTRPGSIVVFHDSYKAEPKLKFILPKYLEHFASLGYQFKALS